MTPRELDSPPEIRPITTLAHKLARIVYHILTAREPYDAAKVATTENYRDREEASLRKRPCSIEYRITLQAAAIEVLP